MKLSDEEYKKRQDEFWREVVRELMKNLRQPPAAIRSRGDK